jgi:hypothetical protein
MCGCTKKTWTVLGRRDPTQKPSKSKFLKQRLLTDISAAVPANKRPRVGLTMEMVAQLDASIDSKYETYDNPFITERPSKLLECIRSPG